MKGKEKSLRKDSKIMREKEEWKTLSVKRMTPEERLVAFFNHSRPMRQIYQVGVEYRARLKAHAL